jgi:hypothetical protein
VDGGEDDGEKRCGVQGVGGGRRLLVLRHLRSAAMGRKRFLPRFLLLVFFDRKE